MESIPDYSPAIGNTAIYGLTDESGTIRYVGLTRLSFKKRLALHLGAAKSDLARYAKRHCYNWIRKLIRSGHSPQIILLEEVIGDGSADEIRWIAKIKSAGVRLTNRSDGGEGCSGWGRKWTDAQRRRMSEMKRNVSDETRRRMSIGSTGIKHSLETRKKLSAIRKGKKMSPARRAQHSRIVQDWWDSHEHNPRNPNHSEETKRKISEAKKMFWAKDGVRQKMCLAAKKSWSDPIAKTRRLEATRLSRASGDQLHDNSQTI